MGLLILIVLFFIGYFLANLFIEKNSLLKIGLSYPLGVGLFTFFWFLFNLTGISYSRKSSLFLLLLMYLVFFLLKKIFKKQVNFNSDMRLSLATLKQENKDAKLLLLILGALVIFVFIANFYWPVKDWDSLVLYDFRAKLFTQSGGMKEAIEQGYFTAYPLLTSLSHALMYLWDSPTPLPVYSLFYLSLLLVFYAGLVSAEVKKNLALTFTLVLAISSRIFEHSMWAYTNLPYLTYFFIGILLAYFGIKEKRNFYIYLSAIFIGLSTWTRFAEPFWLVPAVLVVAIFIKEKIWSAIFFYPAIIYSFRIPWMEFVKKISGLEVATESALTGVITKATDVTWNNLSGVVIYFNEYVIQRFLLLFIMFAFALFYALKTKNLFKIENLFFVFVIIFSIGGVFYGTWIFSQTQSYWKEIGDSVTRMSMFVIPLILFIIPVILSKKEK
jgi:hypothetical protein